MINGNIHAVGDAGGSVLGFFEVASVIEKRAFFSTRDFNPQGLRGGRYPNCNYSMDADTLTVEEMPVYFLGPGFSNLLFRTLDPPFQDSYITLSRWCADCTFLGTIEKPDFWED